MMGYILTLKQANVIFRAWKNGDIQADKNVIDKMYFYADNADFYWDKYTRNMSGHIRDAVELVIRKRFGRAQQYVDNFAWWVECKEQEDAYQAECDKRLAELKAKLVAEAVAC